MQKSWSSRTVLPVCPQVRYRDHICLGTGRAGLPRRQPERSSRCRPPQLLLGTGSILDDLNSQVNYRRATVRLTLFTSAKGIYYSDSPFLASAIALASPWCNNSSGLCGSSEDSSNGISGTVAFVLSSCADRLYFAVKPMATTSGSVVQVEIQPSSGMNTLSFPAALLAPCNAYNVSDPLCAAHLPIEGRNGCVPGCVTVNCYDNSQTVWPKTQHA